MFDAKRMRLTDYRSLIITIFLILCSNAFSQTLKGRIIAIKDGDTIVLLQNNHQYKIRLSSIDCPEKSQAYGTQAKYFTSGLVYRKKVRAEVKTKDRYGRFVAEVFLPDGRSLSRELVRNGFAWHYIVHSYDSSLAELEEQARLRKLGLWKDPHAIPPWDFRKIRRN
jgi:micrococcal nuclease